MMYFHIHFGPVAKKMCLSLNSRLGGPRGRAVKSAVSKSLDHFTAVSGVGFSPVLATCETSQVLLEGVPGGFFSGSSRFRHTY